MTTTTVLIIKIAFFLFSLAVLGFFAGLETALTSLSTISLKNLKAKLPKLALHISFWETKPNEVLATLLVGTNLALVANGVLGTSIAYDLVNMFSWDKAAVLSATTVASILITLLAGDIVPKIFSRYKSERVALAGLPFIVRVSKMISFFNAFLLALSERLIGLLGGQKTREKPFLQADELKVLLLTDESLPISTPARKMMKNIIDFASMRISRVMVPRDKIQAVNLDQPQEKVIEQIIEKEYSRVPVYRGNLDNIVGIIYSKDLALAWRGGSLFVIDDLIRPAYFVPESARVDRVLREFKTGHHHLAVVVDEYGSAAGLATIEDLVEEIVGEIWDEYDIQEKTIFPLPDGSYLLRASESLTKVNEELNINLPANDFASVSGWVLDLFGRIPKVGDTVRWGEMEVEVVDADKRHILRVRIKRLT